MKLVLTAKPLRTVLVVWNVALLGSGGVNVAEVFFAKDTLDAGNVGFGALMAASGIGLALGSFLSAPSLGKVGLRRNYVGSLVLMGVGWGAAALSPTIWLAVVFVIGGAAGNGAVVVCNRLLVQRGAPDQYRGRALATIMSSNYAVLGLAMAAAGVLTDVFGARAVWIGRRPDLPGRGPRRARADALAPGRHRRRAATHSRPAPSRPWPPSRTGTAAITITARDESGEREGGLERIATLLEEIEARREAEARRPTV